MTTELNSVQNAQRDMRVAYANGSTGLIASGLVWIIAGIVACYSMPIHAGLALFIGGMFIFPLSIVICKLMKCSGNHSKDNPLGSLALEVTFMMLVCLPIAYVVFTHTAEWFFPTMMLVIGARYLTFSTLYGLRTYWLCGGALIASGFALVALKAPFITGAFVGGGLELLFAAFIYPQKRHD